MPVSVGAAVKTMTFFVLSEGTPVRFKAEPLFAKFTDAKVSVFVPDDGVFIVIADAPVLIVNAPIDWLVPAELPMKSSVPPEVV